MIGMKIEKQIKWMKAKNTRMKSNEWMNENIQELI